jgi:LacI family transcriptional regulator
VKGSARGRSVRDVAAHAGVSVGTVSNVLNRPEAVAPATRAKVQRAIAELGFVPNESARQLRAGQSRTIGLVVLDVGNPFFTDVAKGVEDAVTEAGLTVILCDSAEQVERESRYLDVLEAQRVRGILITPVEGVGKRIRALRQHDIPVVLVDRFASTRNVCSVSVDDVYGGELAATHLVEQGHRRIAFVGGPFGLKQVQDRYDGARSTLLMAGMPEAALVKVEIPALTFQSGLAAGARIADMRPSDRPTAAFCANDLVALGLLQQMTQARVDVPGELAIIGYDDIEFAGAAAVPLTSVRQPRHELGRAAAELLLAESDATDGHVHEQIIVPAELIVRTSTVKPDGRAGSAR